MIKTRTEDGDGERLLAIYRKLNAYIAAFDKPQFAVLEDLPTHAMSAGLTGRAQGIIRMTLAQYKIPYTAIPPATLKKFATGKGNAKKPVMRQAWLDFSGDDVADDNQVDAAWLRQVGLYLKGEPVDLPADQLKVVDAYKE